jgi:CRP/FNR family cyclic AMP-dependent transcriptional regulator
MATASALIDFEATRRTHKPASATPELTALLAPGVAGGAFTRMAPATQQALASRSTLKDLHRGAVLAAEGGLPSNVFVVISGRVRAVRRGESGREITVDLFRCGDVMADALLAPEQPLLNNWEAIEATSVLVIPRDAIAAELDRSPELSLVICHQLMRRLNASHQLAFGLALSDVEGRVVAALLALGRQEASQNGQNEPGQDLLIRQRPTQQDLANRIGACRETVSRVITALTRRGLVTPQGRGLVLSKRLLTEGP